MNELKVLGQEKIGQYEFTGIEGGFGENKRAMLVKDIAAIHGKEVKEVNRLIKSNINRFKFGIDLLDLKRVISNHLFSEYGFTKAQWGNANNIYMLSERGYAKLLKILEDDKAWDIYDELVDNYFNMRQAIKADNKALVANKRLWKKMQKRVKQICFTRLQWLLNLNLQRNQCSLWRLRN